MVSKAQSASVGWTRGSTVQALHVGWSCSGKNSEAREVFSGGSEVGHRLQVGLSSPHSPGEGSLKPRAQSRNPSCPPLSAELTWGIKL